MSHSQGIPLDSFRVLAERAGMNLSDQELADLKPLYEQYSERVAALHEADLGAEDMAVAFPPDWAPQS